MGRPTLLHLRDKLLVEQSTSLLVERAVDGDDVALSQHLLEIIDTAATDFLLDLGVQGLIIVVEQLLAVEWLQTTQDTLSNTANANGTDDLGFQVILILGHSSNVPVAIADLFVGRDEVAYEDEDGHHDVFGNGDDVAASNFGHGDATIGLVCSIKVDMIGSNTGSDGKLQVLGPGQALCGEISRVEAWTVSRARGSQEKKSTYGVVMMTSASTSSRSKVEFSPSLSDVVTRV